MSLGDITKVNDNNEIFPAIFIHLALLFSEETAQNITRRMKNEETSHRRMEVKLPALVENYDRPTDNPPTNRPKIRRT